MVHDERRGGDGGEGGRAVQALLEELGTHSANHSDGAVLSFQHGTHLDAVRGYLWCRGCTGVYGLRYPALSSHHVFIS